MAQDNIVELNVGQAGSLVAGDIFVDFTNNTISGAGLYVDVLGQPVPLTGLTLTPGQNGTYTIAGVGLGLGNAQVASVNLTLPSTTPTSVALDATVLGLNSNVTLGVTSQIACYCTGTLIRTVEGDRLVESLAIGDVVVTAAGAHRPVKWIGTRSYAGRFANNNPEVLPICIHAGALADGLPVRDLWVSPKHALFLDGCLVPAENLVNGVSVIKADRVDTVTYWHVELDSHDIILAEGVPAESFVDDHSRGMFQNAHEFTTLYSGQQPEPARYCAPRIEHGHALQQIRGRIAARAGLAAPVSRFGTLRGCIEAVEHGIVRGWAQDTAHPHAPVCLDVVVAGRVVAMAYADSFRPDLPADARHAGFTVSLPAGLDVGMVDIRRSADGAVLSLPAIPVAA